MRGDGNAFSVSSFSLCSLKQLLSSLRESSSDFETAVCHLLSILQVIYSLVTNLYHNAFIPCICSYSFYSMLYSTNNMNIQTAFPSIFFCPWMKYTGELP